MAVTRFRLRRDPAAEWTAANPVLLAGEPGFESDSKRMKIGDGVTRWRDLAYIALSNAEVDKIAGDKITADVPAAVTDALGKDTTLVTAAGAAVDDAIVTKGVVTGAEEHPNDIPGTAWRQTTDAGEYLPLGYDANGHLDSFAKQIFKEDVANAKDIVRHPTYSKIIRTENDDLIMGFRWDGGLDIPGLELAAPTPPVATVKPQQYNDAPWSPGSDLYPVHTDMARMSGWGSSSMEGANGAMTTLATELGVTYYNGGKGGEKSDQIAARLGSVPALISIADDTIPATGAVTVTSSNMRTESTLKPYTGWITSTTGERIHGTLASTTTMTFTRTTNGTAATIAKDTPFIPEMGPLQRDAVGVLWMGKNNVGTPQKVLDDTNTSLEFFIPLHRRVLILGHFVNSGTPAVSSTRDNIYKINAEHAARLGRAFIDVNGYLTSPQVWTDTGVTPTQADLDDQALGNKPMSISGDTGHLNGTGYTAVVQNLVKPRLAELGWYEIV